jgi:hypothetical protein
METVLISPAKAFFLGIPTVIFSILIPVVGVAVFTYIFARRLAPLFRATPDPRLDRFRDRLVNTIKIGLGQLKQPRYMMGGVIHIVIFAGFMILSLRSISLVILGISEGFVLPGLGGTAGHVYAVLKDLAATAVLIACVVAIVRRGIFKPERYAVPPKYGKDHTAEAIFVLGLILTLLISEMSFEASQAAAQIREGLETELLIPGTGVWFATQIFSTAPPATLQSIHLASYFIHDLVFFFFL